MKKVITSIICGSLIVSSSIIPVFGATDIGVGSGGIGTPISKREQFNNIVKYSNVESVNINTIVDRYTDINIATDYVGAMQFMYNHRWMIGSGDGWYNPNGYVSRGELAQVIYNILWDCDCGEEKEYRDISGKWYEEAVKGISSRGIRIESEDEEEFNGEKLVIVGEVESVLMDVNIIIGNGIEVISDDELKDLVLGVCEDELECITRGELSEVIYRYVKELQNKNVGR